MAATFLNGAALAVLVAGVVAPVFGSWLGLAASSLSHHSLVVFRTSLATSLVMHLEALGELGG